MGTSPKQKKDGKMKTAHRLHKSETRKDDTLKGVSATKKTKLLSGFRSRKTGKWIRCFRIGRLVLRGVHKTIHEVLTLPLSAKASKDAKLADVESPILTYLPTEDERVWGVQYTNRLTKPRSAMQRGKLADDQWEEVVGGKRDVNGKHVMPQVRNAFRALVELGLEPARTQVFVGSLEMRLGTPVDILCKHAKTGDYVLVEFKAREIPDSKYVTKAHRVSAVNPNVLLSQVHIDLMQSELGSVLGALSMEGSPVRTGLVVNATVDKADVYQVPEWLIKMRSEHVKLLTASANKPLSKK